MTTARECQWSATSDSGWLSLTSGASGQGTAAVAYSVAPNPSPTPRRGGIVVSGQRAEIAQEAAACTASVSPTTVSVGANGGEVRLTIATDEVCPWTAVSQAAWIAIESAPNGTGRAEVTLRIAANAGSERMGTATIAGVDVTVSQAAVTCPVDVTPATFTVAATGGALEVAVTAAAGCAWTASATESWIQLVQGATGSGTGTVRLTILPNAGPARSGFVTVGGRTVRVDQTGEGAQCDYSFSPSTLDVPATGGPFQVQVTTTGSGCAWEVTGTPSWISTTPPSGTGSRPITLTIQNNSGVGRTATIAIGPRQMPVTQAGTSGPPPCSYTIAPNSHSFPSAGGIVGVTVTTPTGCSWTISGAPPWITAPPGGTGTQTVTLTALANTGAARSQNLTIAGQIFSASQAAGCTYSIAPSSHAFPQAGGNVGVAVTTQTACTWTVSGAPSWMTAPPGGTGTQTITLTAAANTGAPRNQNLTIAGQTFSASQAGCTYSIAPNSHSFLQGGSSVNVTVTTQSGCTWTVNNTPSWITAPSGGTGTQPLTLTASTNTSGSTRSQNLTIAGQTFSASQAGCTYSIAPSSHAFPQAGGSVGVTVTTQTGCTWTVSGAPSWITAPPGGTGTQTITLTAAANAGGPRSQNLTIAGQTFGASQAGGCTYSINPTQFLDVHRNGDKITVTITTAAGCSWSVTNNPSWISASPPSGTGGGSTTIMVQENPGPARGPISFQIAGQNFTVSQRGS